MRDDTTAFIENLSLLLKSGMDVLSAFQVLERESTRSSFRKKVRKMRGRITEGEQLWKVLKDSGIFPRYTIALVRIGEKAGKLSDNLEIITEQRQKQEVFRSKLRSAMIYPVFVFSVTMIAALGIAWFILPRLSSVFGQLNVELPMITRWLIVGGDFIEANGLWFFPAVFAGLAAVIYGLFFFPYTKFIGQWMLFQIPGIHGIIVQVEVSRFGFLLGTLLGAGIPIVEAIDSLKRATDFYKYRRFYELLEQRVSEGYSIREVFENTAGVDALFPYTIQNMIGTAERSGSLPETLQEISERYEEKIDALAKNVSVVIEPILLVVVWLIVVGIAAAVILPIYDLVSNLN